MNQYLRGHGVLLRRLGQRLASTRQRGRVVAALGATVVAAAMLGSAAPQAAGASCANPVACENLLPGNPSSQWDVASNEGSTIQGFADPFSVNLGGTITFKIKASASSYKVDIYRMGYYGGNGARLITSVTPNISVSQNQPACHTNTATGLVDCSNWGISASWTVPASLVSGVYFAHIYSSSDGNQIPFVVRDDSSHSGILFKTDDATWQAYNSWGGYSLYTGNATDTQNRPTSLDAGRAEQVSYDRPFNTRFGTPSGQDFFFYAEFPTIQFLEQNGYDMSYIDQGTVASAQGASLMEQHQAVVAAGHDEYWSGPEVANVAAARDAGVSMAFMTGNEVFWKTRWAADAAGEAGRTLITYKESLDSAVTDPLGPSMWTGQWADPRFSPPGDGKPQNWLSGQIWTVNLGTYAIQVPSSYSKLRFWRNTSVANLASGQTATLAPETLGYEWDEDIDNGYRPAGLIDMSSTTQTAPQVVFDYQEDLAAIAATHHLTLYRAASGALFFEAGTVQWAWGLNKNHDGDLQAAPDPAIQQSTINVLADMHLLPTTLMGSLTMPSASTDLTAPTSVITSPAPNANIGDGVQVTVTGTATDAGGGVVAGVEISTDGGASWHPVTTMSAANTSVTWSYSWIAHGAPTATLKTRATDDSGNIETPSDAENVTIGCPCSIWGPNVAPAKADSGDSQSGIFGVKFTSDLNGTVNGIRFYKASTNTGTHIGSLWTAGGQLLASATFTSETSSGWQQVNFAQPVSISANTTYVASYFAPSGHYSESEQYLDPPLRGGASLSAPPLHAALDTFASHNGLYTYATSNTFPGQTFNGENYWVDVAFTPDLPPTSAPGTPTNVTATAGDASAVVTWTAPTGDKATSYTVTPYIGTVAQSPITVTGNPAPTTAQFFGLTNGSTYTFTVTGANSLGSGPVSAPSNAVTPSVSANLVINGGFENGLPPWTASGATALPTVSTAQVHTGGSAALLGLLSGPATAGDSSLAQTLVVPASGTTTLSFWYYPQTADDLCSGAACTFDWQEAQVRNTSGTTLASIFKSNSNSKTWTNATFNLTPYAGQTVQLWFNVHQDSSNPPDDTSMYLDDVSVTNAGGAPTSPAAPTSVTATAGNGQATVSWTAPANGGSTITSYTVTPFIGTTAQATTTVTGSPPATSTTVTGLTNGTAYTFTVTATNAIGTGPASAASNAVTPTAPTTAFVQQVAAHALSVTSLSVTPAGAVTTGNRLVVLVGVWASGNPTAQTVTDAAGNTYTEVLHFKASEGTEMSVWTAPVTAGGGTKPAIKVTPTAKADVGLAVLEYSGLSAAAGTAAIDKMASATGMTGSSSVQVSSGAVAATTAANELAIGFYVDSGFGDSLTAGSGFTQRTNVSPNGDMEFVAEDTPVALGATPAATVTTGASTVWLMATVVFKTS
jgi:hypothetical protein